MKHHFVNLNWSIHFLFFFVSNISWSYDLVIFFFISSSELFFEKNFTTDPQPKKNKIIHTQPRTHVHAHREYVWEREPINSSNKSENPSFYFISNNKSKHDNVKRNGTTTCKGIHKFIGEKKSPKPWIFSKKFLQQVNIRQT